MTSEIARYLDEIENIKMNIISLTFSNSLDNHKNIFVKLQPLVNNINKKIKFNV